MQCTADHSGNEAEWCATQVDAEGEVINKQWGDCDTKSLSCLTLGAGSIGQSRPAPKNPKPPQRASVLENFSSPDDDDFEDAHEHDDSDEDDDGTDDNCETQSNPWPLLEMGGA